jgi:hypothetical protein
MQKARPQCSGRASENQALPSARPLPAGLTALLALTRLTALLAGLAALTTLLTTLA